MPPWESGADSFLAPHPAAVGRGQGRGKGSVEYSPSGVQNVPEGLVAMWWGGHQTSPEGPLVDRFAGGTGGRSRRARRSVLPKPTAALLQQCGQELGAEIVVLPAERVVEIAGQRAQQIVVIAPRW